MKFGNKSILSGILSVLVIVSFGAGNAAADNLLTNSGFETGDLTGWEVFGESPNSAASVVAGDNGPSAPGDNVAFLDNQAEALALTIKQSTPAGSGIEGLVTYSFDLKLGAAGEGGVFFVEIFAEQAGGGVIGGSGVLGNYAPADWTTFSGTLNAPAGTDFLTIQLSAINGANPNSISTMYVDNVSLDQGTVGTEASTLSNVKALWR